MIENLESKNDLTHRVGWRIFNEKEIFIIDLSFLKAPEVMEILLMANDLFKESESNSVKVFLDVTKIEASMTTFNFVKKISKDNQKYICKTAILGVTPSLIPFYQSYQKFTKSKSILYRTKKDAIDYLLA